MATRARDRYLRWYERFVAPQRSPASPSPTTHSLFFIGNGRRLEIVPTEQQQPPQSVPAHETISRPSRVLAADLPYRWKAYPRRNPGRLRWTGHAMDRCDRYHLELGDRAGPAICQAWMDTRIAIERSWCETRGLAATWQRARMGRLELDAHYQRRLNSRVQHVAWLKNRRGEVAGVAVTLSGQNDIWVFTLPANENTCRLKRVFGSRGSGTFDRLLAGQSLLN